MARTLIVKTGDLAGRRITVDRALTIGSGDDADVVLRDADVAPSHARMQPTGTDVEIEDLGSGAGTWVNGARITTSTKLMPGDVVTIGGTNLTLDRGGHMASPTPDTFVPTPGHVRKDRPAGADAGAAPGTRSTGAPPAEPNALYGSASVGPVPEIGSAGFEIIDHTADVGLRAYGATREATLEQATVALATIIGAWDPRPGGRTERVACEARDDAALLAEWLEEVLYVLEVNDAVLSGVQVDSVTTAVDGVVSLVPRGDRTLEGIHVKAITYHQLQFTETDGRWRAQVFVDV